MKKFIVKVENEILGNSEKIMTLDQIKGFNLVAYGLAVDVASDGKSRTSGMWTVSPQHEGRK